jgi:hypothetical protein
MERKAVCGVMLTLLLIGVSAFTLNVQRAFAQTTTMSVSPSSISANLYSNVSISIVIANVSNMYGYEFKLYWNASLLHSSQWNYTTNTWIQDPSTPPIAWTWGPSFFVAVNNITNMPDGRSRYWIALIALYPAAPVSGTFTVVTLNFKAVGEGTTTLDLPLYEGTHLANIIGDINAKNIPHTAIGGSVTTIAHDVAVLMVHPKSPAVAQNSSVEIDVEVKNDGNVPENFTVGTYYNDTATGVVGNVGTQDLTNLAPLTPENLTFVWSTVGVGLGLYEIFANASFVQNELDKTNNQLVDGTVEVVIVVPEFPFTTILSTLMGLSTLALIFTKRKQALKPKN